MCSLHICIRHNNELISCLKSKLLKDHLRVNKNSAVRIKIISLLYSSYEHYKKGFFFFFNTFVQF
ncbi:hypothetical protein PUN28_014202 [Cardiocondyla obscurior]|uniref:Uncharacterized protein n=1 Tax=Cardiocondyla obscurior TaxID=286306 RepID=A0AAW2F2K3_9HYME